MASILNVGHIRSTKQYKRRVVTRVEDYKTLFRFEEENVDWLSEHFLGGDSGERRGGALTPQQRMKIFLRYCADPGFQSGVGEDIGVDQTTVSRVVQQVRLFCKFHQNQN
jgi:hypothetical protein